MKKLLLREAAKHKLQNRRRKRWQKTVSILACLVVFCTVYALILPALTAEADTYCGKEEHTHTEDCYQDKLICGQEEGQGAHHHTDDCYREVEALVCQTPESDGHQHTDACYTEEQVLTCTNTEEGHVHSEFEGCYTTEKKLTCGMEEGEGAHHHTAECYEKKKELICGQEENDGHRHTAECYKKELICGKEEHTHTLACYSNPDADVENGDVWQNTVSSVTLTGNWGADLAATAQTQTGYTESTANYAVAEDGQTIHGYTRYGAWANDPYRDNWSAQFADFCLSYAGVPTSAVPQNSDCSAWNYTNPDGYTPKTGDLLLLDTDLDSSADHAGIVTSADDSTLTAIVGDADKAVRNNTYNIRSENIKGYVSIPENPALADDNHGEETTETTPAPEVTEEPQETPAPEVTEEPQETPKVPSKKPHKSPAKVNGQNNDISVYEAPYNFTENITEVSAKYKIKGQGEWLDLPSDKTIDKDDFVQFNMKYLLPKGSLQNGNKVIQYPLPDSLKKFTGSGYVSAGVGGAYAGTYTIENGNIIITFYDDYAAKNERSDFNGWLSFDGKASEIETGGSEETKITFKQSVDVDVTIKDNVNEKGDISVTKGVSDIDYENGTLKYTIKVNSTNGTWDKVILTDVMTHVQFDFSKDIILKKPDGSSEKLDLSSDTNFQLELDKMAPGAEYELVYYAKIPAEDFANGEKAQNNVTVTSKNNHGNDISDHQKVETDFKDLLKLGTDNGDGTITWTVVINLRKKDIGGWELKDEIGTSNNDLTSLPNTTVHIEPAIENKNEITLPYTFPVGTTDTYTITYTTKAVSNGNTVNKASMTPPGGSIDGKWEVTEWKWAGENKQLKKSGTGTEKNSDNTLTLRWKVTIDPQKDITGEWNFKDELKGGQWFTEQQYNDIVTKWKAKLGEGNFTITPINSSDNKKIGYEIISSQPWFKEENQKFELEYSSTADIPENDTTYYNKVHFKEAEVTGNNDYKPSSPPTPTTPTVRKVDANDENGGSSTEHDYYAQNGLMKWRIEVSGFEKKENADGQLVITEYLPDGVTLESLTVASEQCANGVSFNLEEVDKGTDKETWRWKAGLYDADEGNYTINAKKYGNDIVISIPKELIPASEYKICVDVVVKINDEGVTWKPDTSGNSSSASFSNHVSVTDIDRNDLGTASQTQTIIKVRNHGIIGKKAATRKGNNIPYEITINPEGKDLVEESGQLTLTDELVYNTNNSKVKMSLVPGSFKVIDARTNQELSSNQYSMTYEEVKDDSKGTCTNKMTITIPDETPLIIKYEYNASGEKDTWTGEIRNTATLMGIAGDSKTSNQVASYQITSSSAGVETKGLTLYKVDSAHSNQFLSGAQFKLYKWAKDKTGTYGWIDDTDNTNLISDSDGKVTIATLTKGVAYKLEETKPPAGYEISAEMKNGYFFYITNEPSEKPENVSKWNVFQEGEYFYYPNTKSTSYTLPETGGTGVGRFTAVGLILMAGSLAGFMLRQKHRVRSGK